MIYKLLMNVYWGMISLNRKKTIQAKLTSLAKRKVFRPEVQTLKGIKPNKYKWVFVQIHKEGRKWSSKI